MFKRISITASLLAAAALFQPAQVSAQDRHDQRGYANWDNRGSYDYGQDRDRGRDRREYRGQERRENEWRDRARFENRYDRTYYYNAPAYGYYYSNPRQCR